MFFQRQHTSLRLITGVLTSFIVLTGCSDESNIQKAPSFPWKFVEIARLDTENNEALVGGYLGQGISIDGEGNVSVASTAHAGIHQFQANGMWIKNLGREGDGPGEFRSIQNVSASFDGDLLLYDSLVGTGRITHLDNNDIYQQSFRARLSESIRPAIGFADRDRYWLFDTNTVANGLEAEESLILVDAKGNDLWSWRLKTSPYLRVSAEGRSNQTLGPGENAVRWSVDRNGISWILLPGGETLLRISPSTTKIDTISTNLQPIYISDQKWDRYVQLSTDYMKEVSFLRPFVKSMTDALNDLRRRLHPAQRFWCVDEHGFLIDRLPSSSPNSQEDLWLYAALLPNGRMSEEIEGPARLIAVCNGYAVQINSAWMELPILTLYRLEKR